MKNDLFEIGDTVKVNINNAQTTLISRAKITHMPCATGDSWHFRCLDSGELYYVSEGCTISTYKPLPF